MDITFGPIRQIGYVVRDVQRSARFYAERLGAGPWFILNDVSFSTVHYRGELSRGKFDIAVGNWGDMQLEFIQPLDTEPSIYTEWLVSNPHNEVMHHVSTWTSSFDEDTALARKLGYDFVVEGGSQRGRFCYLEHSTNRGALIEVSELTPERSRIWEAVAEAARGWDGSDPIRTGWPGQ